MEVISPSERLSGFEFARQSVRIQQLGEETDGADDEEEANDKDGWGFETEAEDYSSSEESLIMQIAVVPECVNEDFGTSESPVQVLEFEMPAGEKKVAKIGAAVTGEEKKQLKDLFTRFEHLFITRMFQMPQTILGTHHIVLKEGVKPAQQKLRRIKP